MAIITYDEIDRLYSQLRLNLISMRIIQTQFHSENFDKAADSLGESIQHLLKILQDEEVVKKDQSRLKYWGMLKNY
jgi:hypothetical protein